MGLFDDWAAYHQGWGTGYLKYSPNYEDPLALCVCQNAFKYAGGIHKLMEYCTEDKDAVFTLAFLEYTRFDDIIEPLIPTLIQSVRNEDDYCSPSAYILFRDDHSYEFKRAVLDAGGRSLLEEGFVDNPKTCDKVHWNALLKMPQIEQPFSIENVPLALRNDKIAVECYRMHGGQITSAAGAIQAPDLSVQRTPRSSGKSLCEGAIVSCRARPPRPRRQLPQPRHCHHSPLHGSLAGFLWP